MSTMDGTQTTFRLGYHVIIAAAMALVAPATGFAWAVAILTGLVIAADDADRRAGIRVPALRRVSRVLAVTGGVLGMLIAGALIGGLVAGLCAGPDPRLGTRQRGRGPDRASHRPDPVAGRRSRRVRHPRSGRPPGRDLRVGAVNARWGAWLLLGVVAAVGAVGGAIWDWYNWHPMSAVVATLVAIPLVLIGVVLLIIRARRSRQVGGVVLALGLGIVAGQVLGPSRPDFDGSSGSVTVALEQPHRGDLDRGASCTYDTEGQFQVSGDPNMRLPAGPADPAIPADVDGRPFVSFHLTVG